MGFVRGQFQAKPPRDIEHLFDARQICTTRHGRFSSIVVDRLSLFARLIRSRQAVAAGLSPQIRGAGCMHRYPPGRRDERKAAGLHDDCRAIEPGAPSVSRERSYPKTRWLATRARSRHDSTQAPTVASDCAQSNLSGRCGRGAGRHSRDDGRLRAAQGDAIGTPSGRHRDDGGGCGMDVAGHAALVTGGGSGMGAETARALAAAGARVAVLDVNMDGASQVAAETGGVALECDVVDAASGEAAVAAAPRGARPRPLPRQLRGGRDPRPDRFAHRTPSPRGLRPGRQHQPHRHLQPPSARRGRDDRP